MTEQNAVVGLYETHAGVEASIRGLREAGFDMTKLSIAGKDEPWALLCGSALFLIPGIGSLSAFGPLAGWIAGALESRVVIGGLTTLGAALYGIGFPEDCIVGYEAALRSGRYLVIAHGTAEEAGHAREVIETGGPGRTGIHPYLPER